MKYVISVFFILFLMLPSIVSAKIYFAVEKEDQFSIYPEYQYIQGKVQKYFGRCNPCTLYVVIDDEDKFFQELRLRVNVGFSDVTGYDCNCFSIIDLAKRGWCNAPCGVCYKTSTWMCQELGYHDVGCSPEGYWGNCKQCDVACYNFITTTSSLIELKYGNQLLFRATPNNIPTETENLAEIVNEVCGNHIQTEINERKAGQAHYNYECRVPLTASADLSGGSIDLEVSKITYTECGERYCLTTTTSTIPTTTLTTIIIPPPPPENNNLKIAITVVIIILILFIFFLIAIHH